MEVHMRNAGLVIATVSVAIFLASFAPVSGTDAAQKSVLSAADACIVAFVCP